MTLPNIQPETIDELHQENARFLRSQQYRRSPAQKCVLARRVEARVARQLAAWGYQVCPTTHNAPFDLWVEGARVEIKAARWYCHQRGGGRYQANVRQHQADVLIFDCINGADHYFIIPMAVIVPRRSLVVTSHNPAAYGGQWAEFLDAWEHLAAAVEAAQDRDRQLSLL